MKKLYLIFMICIFAAGVFAAPPFKSMASETTHLINEDDQTSFDSLESAGRAVRAMYDNRIGRRIRLNAYLFKANFDDLDHPIPVVVNDEFNSDRLRPGKRKNI